MSQITVFILVRDEPYGFSELTGMIRRQDEEGFETIAFVPPDLSKATAHMVERNFKNTRVVARDDMGGALNEAVKSAARELIVILDSAFLPSNQVWLNRLTAPLKAGDAEVVTGRLAHDLYTNWLIQNDFACDQNLVNRGGLPPFYFQFANFAAKKSVLAANPFPSSGIDDFALRWALDNSIPHRFVADAVVTHLEHISLDGFVEAYRRYGRHTRGLGKPLRESLKLFWRGIGRDAAFALSKRKPQWLFFSLYFRARQAMGFYKGSVAPQP
ncbi:MAG: glycosyltransferase [Nitrospinae bacterium]|nr:glycosyltransferase [Nitrospinota bacterium]